MTSSVDALLEKLLGQYHLLVFFIIVSNITHVYLNQHLLHHYLWTPSHHCKVPTASTKSKFLPLKSNALGKNELRVSLAQKQPMIKKAAIYDAPDTSKLKGKTFQRNTRDLSISSEFSTTEDEDREKREENTSNQTRPWHRPFRVQNQTILVWKGVNDHELPPPQHSRGLGNDFASCEMYVEPGYPANGTQPCVDGYVFDVQGTEWSVAAEWDLVCEHSWLRTCIKRFHTAGLMAGGLIFGPLTDRFGRRLLLLLCLTALAVTGLSLYFVKRFFVFFILECIQAMFSQGLHLSSWSLLTEIFPPKWRCRCLMVAGVVVPFGSVLAAVASMQLRHWRAIQLASSLPVVASLCYSYLIPESLRWYLVKGKVIRAHKEANRMARLNVVSSPPITFAHLKTLSTNFCNSGSSSRFCASYLIPFKSRRMRKHLLIALFLWFTVAITENIFAIGALGSPQSSGENKVSRSVSLLLPPGNSYIKCIVENSVQVGGVIVAVMLSSLFYRRSLLMMLLLCTAAVTLVLVILLKFVDESKEMLPIVWILLKMVGVLIISGTRAVVQVIISEVSPTTLRATAMGLCIAIYSLGQILPSFLLQLGDATYEILPWVLCCVLCLFGALLIFILPETSGINLPDIPNEAKLIGFQTKGDIIKSDKDPSYGRARQSMDLGRLVANYSSFRTQEQNRNLSLRNYGLLTQPSLAQALNNNYTQRPKNTYSNPFRSINATFPKLKQNKYINNLIRSSESTLTTSSCSLYSSRSFVGMSRDSSNSCFITSIKRDKFESTQNNGCLSDEAISTDVVSEGNISICPASENKEIGNSSIKLNIDVNGHSSTFVPNDDSRSGKIDSRDKLTDIAEESEVITEKGKTPPSIRDKDQYESHKNIPKSLETLNTPTFHSAQNLFKNEPEPPKVISSVPKINLPNTDPSDEYNKKKIEICTIQPIHTKRPNSPTDLNRPSKYSDSNNKNPSLSSLPPICQNKKLQSLVSKSVQRNSSTSKLPRSSNNAINKSQEILKPGYNRSDLSRQNSSFQGLRPNYESRMDNRKPKTQSFMIPRRPQMGKKVALRIERFENIVPSIQDNGISSKIPVLSSSSLRRQNNPLLNYQIYSQSNKSKIPPPSVKEKVKHFENNDDFLLKRITKDHFNTPAEKSDDKATTKPSHQRPQSKDFSETSSKSGSEDKFIVPKSNIEIMHGNEAFL